MHPLEVRRAALELIASGETLNAVSKQIGVSRAALREWRDSPDALRADRCPVEGADHELDSAAYAELLGFYLGDGCISTYRGKHVLRVVCDETYPGVIENVTSLIERVRPNGKVFHVPATGCLHVTSNWKHWPCFFPQHGPGRKHERTLVLAGWQQPIVTAHPGPLLRGLFHSDGCRFTNWTTRQVAGESKRYEYGRWMFSNNSTDIMRWCQEALERIGVHWTMPRWNNLSVARRADVALLDELIGPKR